MKMTEGALKSFKQHHQNLFQENGLNISGESYQFTNFKRFIEEMPTATETHTLPTIEENSFLFIDGKLTSAPKIEGLSYYSLPEEMLGELNQTSAFSHLHHGMMDNVLVIEIQKNTEIKQAIKLYHIINNENIAAPTIWVIMNPFSKMALLEETLTSRTSYLQVSESYLNLGEGAHLEHIQLDLGSESSLHHGSTWSNVSKDASYTNLIFNLKGKLNRRNLDVKLKAPGANAESYALFLTSQNEHSDISTVFNHEFEDTTSNQIAKGILGGDSKGIFTGRIKIHPKAQRVSSGQLNRNLLLSNKAHIHSQPQLEIFADDVKCSHGSTTGQLSDEEIFYFKARGIPEEKAKTLLAFGFALEIVLKIKNSDIKGHVETAVLKILKEKFQLGAKA